MRATCLFLALLTAAPALAQTQTRVFYNNDSDAKSGGSNTFPWSREQLRYQVIFPASLFQGRPWIINDILAAPQLSMSPTRRTAIYDDIEIRIGQTAATTLSTNWAVNNPKPKTVHRGPLRCDFEVGVWRGLGMDNTFTYIPLPTEPNLCVEFIIWKMDPGSATIRAVTTAAPRAYFYQWTQSQSTAASTSTGSAAKMGLVLTSANWVEAGSGCQGSTNNTPTLSAAGYPHAGQPFKMTASGGLPSSVGIVLYGLSRRNYLTLQLPFDLQPLGSPGCLVWNEPLITAGFAFDASGNGGFSFPVPTGFGNFRLYSHVWNLDAKANAWGLTTSNLGVMLVGN